MITIIIPAYNAQNSIQAAIQSCAGSKHITKVIVICDASPDKTYQNALEAQKQDPSRIEVINCETNIGAGECRNVGLDKVLTDHVAFLDADDVIEPQEFDKVFEKMGSDDDLAIAQYRYCKTGHDLNEYGLCEEDARIFSELLKGRDKVTLGYRQNQYVATLVNYPWNKIYKTGLIRDNDIRYQSLPVHNDIYFHWACIMKAEVISLHSEKIVNHFVYDNRNQMTNDTSDKRLALFQALGAVRDLIHTDKKFEEFLPPFYQFAQTTIKWCVENLNDQYKDVYVDLLGKFLHDFTIQRFNAVYQTHPAIACNMTILRKYPRMIMNPNFKL